MKRYWIMLSKGLAVLGAIPLVLFATASLAGELPRFADDPCFVWGQSGGSLKVGVPPCVHGMGGTSETKTAAITRLVMIQGGMLVASALALVGAFRGRRLLCLAAFVMILVMSVPLLVSGLGVVTLLSALCFLPACFLARRA